MLSVSWRYANYVLSFELNYVSLFYSYLLVEFEIDTAVSLSIPPRVLSSVMLPLLFYFLADIFFLRSFLALRIISGGFFSLPNLID